MVVLMDKLELYGHITETGVIKIHNRRLMEDWAQGYKGKKIKIRIEKAGSKRSLPQNAYYWGVVVEEIRYGLLQIGYQMTKEETHYWLKYKFNPINIPGEGGEAIEVPDTTTTLTKTGFAEYIEKIAQFAAEYLNIIIPPPTAKLELEL
jgi:hypothetical protein